MRPLLVGMSPARPDREGLTPFVATASGRNLARHLGLSSDECLPRHFDLVNVVPWCTKGVPWPVEDARDRARLLSEVVFDEYEHVVLLGKSVAQAFDESWIPHFELRDGIATCPHPSGLVLWWNDPMNRRAARQFLWSLR